MNKNMELDYQLKKTIQLTHHYPSSQEIFVDNLRSDLQAATDHKNLVNGNRPNNGKAQNTQNIPDEKENAKPFSFCKLPRRSKYTLVLCFTAYTFANCAFALLAPFFPIEAEKKGMSLTLSGFVFSFFQVIVLIISPLFGNFLTKLGPKTVYCSGICVTGVSNIVFGTLNRMPDGTPFFVTTVLCRAVEGIGFAGFSIASFAIMAAEFPDHVGIVLGIFETGSGIGYMIGPSLGGVLFELGGYGLPFYAIGGAILINGILVFRFLPTIGEVAYKRKGSMLYLLRSPMIVFPLLCVFSGGIAINCFDSTIAKHLQPFNISTGIIGLIFGVMAIIYSVTSLFWGYLTDTKDMNVSLIIIGQLIVGVGFLIMGPSILFPFLPFTMLTFALGFLFTGIAYGLVLIPTVKCMVQGACELGFENNIDTYGLISGLFNSIYTLSGVIGPIGVGAIVQQYDYPIAYTVVGLLDWAVMLITAIFFGVGNLRNRNIDAYTQLD